MIEITRYTEDRLNRHLWRFYVDMDYAGKIVLTLTEYHYQGRPTRRHKWLDTMLWTRNYTGPIYGIRMASSEVKLPDDVKAEAIEIVRARITVAEIGQ